MNNWSSPIWSLGRRIYVPLCGLIKYLTGWNFRDSSWVLAILRERRQTCNVIFSFRKSLASGSSATLDGISGSLFGKQGLVFVSAKWALCRTNKPVFMWGALRKNIVCWNRIFMRHSHQIKWNVGRTFACFGNLFARRRKFSGWRGLIISVRNIFRYKGAFWLLNCVWHHWCRNRIGS